MSLRRARRLAALIALVLIGATGCKFNGIYSMPLPGAVANGGHTYTLNVEFRDVQDLVPYSAVKVNDATVGHVKSVTVQGHHALVVVQLKDSVVLPQNSTALISQTSLLGEKFVELQPPAQGQGRGRLTQGMTIGLADTDSDATVEEVLGALSLVLNGGGLQQVQTISQEINKALTGREGSARDLISQMRTFAGGLDNQKNDIITALDRINHLAATIRAQEPVVTNAIDRLPAALQVLADNRVQLTKMLTALSNLGTVATRVINGSRDNLLANLRDLEPTLTELAKAGDAIPKGLQILITFPEADGTQSVYRGDYTNFDMVIDLSQLVNNFGLNNPSSFPGGLSGNNSGSPKSGGTSSNSKSIPVPPVSSIPQLPQTKAPGGSNSKGGGGGGNGGLLGGTSGLLGANDQGSAVVTNGPLNVPLSTPLDRLLLGVLQ